MKENGGDGRAIDGHESRRGVVRKFVTTLLPTVLALVVQLATFALTARGLGPASFGEYNLILAVSAVAVELVGLGGADLLVRATARDRLHFPERFANMVALILVTLPPVALAATVFVAFGDVVGLSVGMIAVAVVAETLVARAGSSAELVMVAHGETAAAGVLRVFVASVRLVAAVVTFHLLAHATLHAWVVAVAVQSVIVVVALQVILARRHGAARPSFAGIDLRGGAGFAVIQTARAAQSSLDRIVLANFADAASLGVYSAASRMLQVGLFPIQVATRMTYPRFFQEGAHGVVAARRYGLKVAPFYALVGVGAGAAVALAAWVLPWVLGREFAGTRDLAVWLALAMPMVALQYPAADVLTGSGRQSVRAVVSVAATVILGPLLAVGAAMGGTGGLVLAFVVGQFLLCAALWIATFLVGRRS